ncbi:ATP phosphoribosyltransferase regulatory subunit, partial [Actinophytocola sp.]|uniref:ATP phosphoribosyltransferase regulatory subunit n=1 Tax=Actinophytocola sp. TaxID=1872138 RepID=UPI002D7EB306
PEPAWDGLFVTLDKLDKIGWDGVRAELAGRGLEPAQVDTLAGTIGGLHGLDEGELVDALAAALPGLGEDMLADLRTTTGALGELARQRDLKWEFDPTLVRGMGYYTGQIFEIVHPASAGSVAGGGRYDRLIGRFLGADVPACGFSIGFERIVDLLGAPDAEPAVAVLYEADVAPAVALAVARRLRADGRVVSPIRRRGKFGAQLGRLTEWGFGSFTHLRADTDPAAPLEVRSLGQT